MAMYAYVRVSSTDQNEDRQVLAMKSLGVPDERIYIDKSSGKDFERARYRELTETLKTGDLVLIKSIDRLGRNYDEIQNEWRVLTRERGIDIAVIDMPLLDTRHHRDLMGTFIADLVLQILSFLAHSERDFIRQRQAEGIAAARMRGVRLGRPRIETPPDFASIISLWECGELSFDEAVSRTGFKQATFYKRLREHREGNK